MLKSDFLLNHQRLNRDQVELKAPKQIPSDSLQNPSDPDATYSGHKGQGYQVQVQETFSDQEEGQGLRLITHVEVEPAHNSDANALIPAIESTQERNLKTKELTADSLYCSDDNHKKAREYGVELTAPTICAIKPDKFSRADFEPFEMGRVIACPNGHCPATVKKRKRSSTGFSIKDCESCPDLSKCPVKKGKKYYFPRFPDKEMRIARRRKYERTEDFQDRYRWRSGVEATMSEYDRRTGVKKLQGQGPSISTLLRYPEGARCEYLQGCCGQSCVHDVGRSHLLGLKIPPVISYNIYY